MPLSLKEEKDGVLLKVKVQPKASRNQIVGSMEDALKIRLTAPPVDGKANLACLKFLAETFRVSRQQVELVSGQTGRQKLIRIIGLSPAQIQQALGISSESGD
ncbi:MAG: DUF167 family protein [Clostridia bacterium]|nr:DUF167 family protein [Clostridia bacterium]